MDIDPIVLSISPQDTTLRDIPLDPVVITASPQEFFSGNLFVYLDDEGTCLRSTITFPYIQTPLAGKVYLPPVLVNILPSDIGLYKGDTVCDMRTIISRLLLKGSAGPTVGDPDCAMSNIISIVRDGGRPPMPSMPSGGELSDCQMSTALLNTYGEDESIPYHDIWFGMYSQTYARSSNSSFSFDAKIGEGNYGMLLLCAFYYMKRYPPINSILRIHYMERDFVRIITTIEPKSRLTTEVWYILSPLDYPVVFPMFVTIPVSVYGAFQLDYVNVVTLWFSGVAQTAPIRSFTNQHRENVSSIVSLIESPICAVDFVACNDEEADIEMGPYQLGLASIQTDNIAMRSSVIPSTIDTVPVSWEETGRAHSFCHTVVSLNPHGIRIIEPPQPILGCEMSEMICGLSNRKIPGQT